MTEKSFPLVAILPDLWTVYRGITAVSQHAKLKLAVDHVNALVQAGAGRMADYSVLPPEHSQVVVAIAKRAIDKARQP